MSLLSTNNGIGTLKPDPRLNFDFTKDFVFYDEVQSIIDRDIHCIGSLAGWMDFEYLICVVAQCSVVKV